MNKKNWLLLVGMFLFQMASAQDTVKLMSYNLLNYFSDEADSALRNPFFRTTINAAKPDILATMEIESDATSLGFLSNVMQPANADYQRAPYIDGYDTNSSLYFLSTKFSCTSNIPIKTDLRDVNQYILVHKATGDTLRVFVVHLKADEGTSEEQQRLVEVNDIRNVTNKFSPNTAFVVCGDFNFYGSTAPGYMRLLQADAGLHGEFYDPITMTGTWNNHKYAAHHTQSPRVRSFGGGSTGGMDDRFDLILFSASVNTFGKVRYVEGSELPYGNDGLHFNDSINRLPNLSAPVDVIEALHYGSDHLPVTARFVFDTAGLATGVRETAGLPAIRFYPNPVGERCFVQLPTDYLTTIALIDLTGNAHLTMKASGLISIPFGDLPAGVYFLQTVSDKVSGTYKIVHY